MTRGKLPGVVSDWRRIANDETFVAPILRTFIFLSASDPVIQSNLNKWHVPTAQCVTNVQSLKKVLNNGQNINNVLVENHYLAMIYRPQYTTI